MANPPSSSPPPGEPAAGAAGGATAKVWTILEVLRWTTSRFAERGIATARLDAELLAAHAFNLTRVRLYAEFDRPLTAGELGAFRELVKRRQAGEPVAYLTGHKEFWSLSLAVDRRVLIPRPDTETAVEVALELGRAHGAAEAAVDDAEVAAPGPETPAVVRPLRIADVGTGSGAIALALKKELPHAEVLAVDISPDALAVARANADRLGLGIELALGHLAEPLAGAAPLDLVVANLPYIPRGDLAGLAPEVKTEPGLALDGGVDGLDLVRALVLAAGGVIGPGGALVLEIGAGQAAATAGLLADAGFTGITTRRDLGGIERVVFGRRPEAG